MYIFPRFSNVNYLHPVGLLLSLPVCAHDLCTHTHIYIVYMCAEPPESKLQIPRHFTTKYYSRHLLKKNSSA